MKYCVMSYLSSDGVTVHRVGKSDTTASTMNNSILRGWNAMLSAIQADYPTTGRNVAFSKRKASSGLNGLFTNDGLKGMLEGKEYRSVDYIFPFLAAFADRCLCRVDNHEQTTVHTKYTELMNIVTRDGIDTCVTSEEIEELVVTLKRLVVHTFQEQCENGIFPLKFHTLDHLSEDISRFGSVQFLDARACEHFKLSIKKSYRTSSMRTATMMSETVKTWGVK